MDLETIIQSEISQTGKNKYSILSYICRIGKKWYRQSYLQSRNRDVDVGNKHMDIKGGMWDGMN